MHSKPPLFSIVIPTYNRPEQLDSCLQAIEGLTCPRDRFEVIVVDDGSRTPLDSIVNKFSDRVTVRLILQSNAGPVSARNRGAAEAKGDFLVFTDDDCAPSSSWLHALADAFRDTPDCGIGGKTINNLNDNLYSATSQLLLDYLYEYYNQDLDGAKFFASNNMVFPRRVFWDSGGFDNRYRKEAAEDRELCDRWISQGRRLRYAPDALVSHTHALTLNAKWRQHFNYGRGAFAFRRMRAERDGNPVKVKPFLFYLNMFTYTFKYFSLGRAMGLATLLIVTKVATTCGYFMEGINYKTGR